MFGPAVPGFSNATAVERVAPLGKTNKYRIASSTTIPTAVIVATKAGDKVEAFGVGVALGVPNEGGGAITTG
jgi:hypothetical protein